MVDFALLGEAEENNDEEDEGSSADESGEDDVEEGNAEGEPKSEYELFREEQILRNESILKSLGLEANTLRTAVNARKGDKGKVCPYRKECQNCPKKIYFI